MLRDFWRESPDLFYRFWAVEREGGFSDDAGRVFLTRLRRGALLFAHFFFHFSIFSLLSTFSFAPRQPALDKLPFSS